MHITDQKSYLWQDILHMENGGTGLVSVIFHMGCISDIMLCLVPELLRQRLHKTEAV